MTSYEIDLTGRARKQYSAFDPVIRNRLRAALNDLSNDPTPSQVKALAGSGGLLRIRVGDWRIIYSIEHDHACPPADPADRAAQGAIAASAVTGGTTSGAHRRRLADPAELRITKSDRPLPSTDSRYCPQAEISAPRQPGTFSAGTG